MALRHRDVVALYLEDASDRDSGQGFLGSDPTGHQGSSIDESLVVIPSQRISGQLEYPPNYQARCLFRIDVGRGYTSSTGDDIVYGQAVTLVHVSTGMFLTATTQEDVQLQPTLQSGAYFLVEPRYKLRSEGEKARAAARLLHAGASHQPEGQHALSRRAARRARERHC